MKHSITMREKVGYSLGDVAANLAFQMMMIYQLKFYTDIFGLDGAIAGTVLLIAPLVTVHRHHYRPHPDTLGQIPSVDSMDGIAL